ncbi:MAG: pantoate--beta-alanine ligase [Deltaproteobacteria bacterium]
MKLVRNIAKMQELSRQIRSGGLRLSLVPTMGYLHEGHLSLVRRARELSDVVVVSLFVNPTQFNDPADLESYLRDEESDGRLCQAEGVDVLFVPEAADVYVDGAATTVTVGRLGNGLCGASRPGHFDGVATVVAALFNMVAPDVAVFGDKDYQQLQIIRRMARDMHFDVAVESGPTVREDDGLAMSSRNARLDAGSREAAVLVPEALASAHRAWWGGCVDAAELLAVARAVLEANNDAIEIDYLELVDGENLQPVAAASAGAVVAVAVRLGGVRLIDNIVLGSSELGCSEQFRKERVAK